MELFKKKIHMDRVKTEAVSQIVLEDDLNVPEQKPDVEGLNFSRGCVLVDEVRPGADHVDVRGRLSFNLLYHTQEDGGRLACLEGKIPFEEKVNLQGALGTDHVTVTGKVEDFSVGIINSRKLSVRSVLTLDAWVEELYDEEVPVGIEGGEAVEYRKAPVEAAQIAISKNDIFRIKEEVSLPANYPNVFQVLFDSVELGEVEVRVLAEKIQLQGEVRLFLLYEGEGEERPVRAYECRIPFGGMLDCQGCREDMIPDIRYELAMAERGQLDFAIRPDLDGEERVLSLELVLNIAMKLYEEEKVEMVTDVYGTSEWVEASLRPAQLRRLLGKVNGKCKVADHVRVGGGNILQLLHSEGSVNVDEEEIVDGGVRLSGSLCLDVLYVTDDDEAPYANIRAHLPFQYTLEVGRIAPSDAARVKAQVEQLQVAMLDGEEMDVKAILSFSTTVFANEPMELIQSVSTRPLDAADLSALPGMAIYFVKPGDNLWNIGKRYFVPVESIRQWNGLQSDTLSPGQKLLIVKGA